MDQSSRNIRRYLFPAVLLIVSLCFPPATVLAADGQDSRTPVEISGDTVEFLIAEDKVVAEGNVAVVKDDVTMLADRIEFSNATGLALAEGNVTLIRGDERLTGDKMAFDFVAMQGDFEKTRWSAKPVYGAGDSLSKVGKNHLLLRQGYLTTCDHDQPHFRLLSKKIDIYPGDKAVARHVRLLVGDVPVMYIPRYTQDLSGRRPAVSITPGYDGDWGPFLLTKWRYQLSEHIDGALLLDYRQKKDLAWGINAGYRTGGYGSGALRTYYMNERTVETDIFEERTEPTVERERYKVEWRHKWAVDPKTQAVAQYYKLSDSTLLKDYFEREYDQDGNPPTYFLLTRTLPAGTMSLRADVRVNRFVEAVERLPELSYNLFNHPLGGSGFYFRNNTTYSNLVKTPPSPTEIRYETMRVDTDNELSYPTKIGFIEFKPYVGGRHTYYSRAIDPAENNSVRAVFRSGADLSTKFYRVFDARVDRFGLNINRLRHVITPSVAYLYQNDPSIPNAELNQFDSVDDMARAHTVTFSLENKLQTKQNNVNVDLARVILGSVFRLKEDPGKGGFNEVTADIEVRPYDWLRFYFDGKYDTIAEHLNTANMDMYIHDPDGDWYVNFSKRYNREVDDLLTAEWGYRLNPKWALTTFHRYDLDTGTLKEQQYSVVRDLHAWEMDLTYNETRGDGSEVWLVFTMKAFPDIGFDFGTSFNKRKAGGQPGS